MRIHVFITELEEQRKFQHQPASFRRSIVGCVAPRAPVSSIPFLCSGRSGVHQHRHRPPRHLRIFSNLIQNNNKRLRFGVLFENNDSDDGQPTNEKRNKSRTKLRFRDAILSKATTIFGLDVAIQIKMTAKPVDVNRGRQTVKLACDYKHSVRQSHHCEFMREILMVAHPKR